MPLVQGKYEMSSKYLLLQFALAHRIQTEFAVRFGFLIELKPSAQPTAQTVQLIAPGET